jgi:outer membrane protein
VNGELRALRDKLIADDRALTAQKAQLAAADFSQKAAALQTRARELDTLTRTRDSQLTRTRDDAVAQISKAALPLLNASLVAHRCAIVFDRTPVYSVNPVMDLTGDVIQMLNSAMPSISVQLAAPQAPAAQ